MPHKEINKDYLHRVFNQFAPVKLKYKDIFDMKEFYSALFYWLKEYGWQDGEGSVSQERFETLYSEKVTGDVMEHWIRWRINKQPEGTSRMHYYLDINFHTLALGKAEIIRNGKKIKANKGEVEVVMHAFIEKKYLEELENDNILKHFKNIFSKRVYKKEFEAREKELYQEVYVLQNFIKQWFKLKRYLPYEEAKSWFPSHSWPSHHKEPQV